jgi:hypothetical protein
MRTLCNHRTANRRTPNRRCATLARSWMVGRTVRAIVDALSQGEPVDRIARRVHVSKQSVRGVRERECVEIDRRKQLIAAQAARGATEAFDQLNERLLTEKIPTALLVPIAGMCTDKVIALGDPTLTLRHDHFHHITKDDLLAFAVARSEKQAKATVLEVPTLPA